MTNLFFIIGLIVICLLIGSRFKILRGLGMGIIVVVQAIGGFVFFSLAILAAGCAIWSLFN